MTRNVNLQKKKCFGLCHRSINVSHISTGKQCHSKTKLQFVYCLLIFHAVTTFALLWVGRCKHTNRVSTYPNQETLKIHKKQSGTPAPFTQLNSICLQMLWQITFGEYLHISISPSICSLFFSISIFNILFRIRTGSSNCGSHANLAASLIYSNSGQFHAMF